MMKKISKSEAENLPLLRFPHKVLRSAVIREYMHKAGYEKAVCFSCGNAAIALEDAGIVTVHIGKNGILSPNKWFTTAEIKHTFTDCFDATSGHLTVDLMQKIGDAYKDYVGKLSGTVFVPTGSGETLCCLKFAYQDIDFVAVRNIDDATKFDKNAPLNTLVELLAKDVFFVE